jgi:hypothetical protein
MGTCLWQYLQSVDVFVPDNGMKSFDEMFPRCQGMDRAELELFQK